MKADLTGRVALVTGAGRGIGRAISITLADAGAKVFLTARSADQLEETVLEIRARGREADCLAADVSSEADAAAVFAALQQRFGRLDALVNNAGQGIIGPVADLPVSALDTMLAVNVRGLYLFCQKALQVMIPARSGYIVNIASVAGFRVYAGQGAYAASKHAVMGITKGLAVEGQPHGIRVSAVLPGAVDTALMTSMRPDLDKSQLMRPEDVADAVLYLLSLSETCAVDEIYIRRRSSAPF
jgi:NAD(P)-dependent dehydrogenase (short-subunit alcohol dehydrogenase family)